MKKIKLFAVMAMLLVLLTSCGGKSALVGQWKEIGGSEVMEFFDDGTCSIDEYNGSYSVSGDRLKLQIWWKAYNYSYKISNNKLTLYDENGDVEDEYERVKN